MKDLELNKITASVLLAALIAMIGGTITNILYKPNLTSDRGYKVEVQESEGNVVAEQKDPFEGVDIKKLIAEANASNGQNVYKKCATCHTKDQNGANKVGPNIWKIVDNKVTHNSSYAYSQILQDLAKSEDKNIWTEENLFHFIYNPRKHAPGTKMTFAGIKDFKELADLILYLKQDN